MATLRSTPTAITPEVTRLVRAPPGSLGHRDALRAFADELDDSTGDLIAATSSSVRVVAALACRACSKGSPSQ